MSTRFKRADILKKLYAEIGRGEPVLITEAGIGITAKCQAFAGTDAILVSHTARMRMAGFGSAAGFFAYKNSTDVLYQAGHDILPLIPNTPAIAGITAAEPFRKAEDVIDDMIAMGFDGICNTPSTGWNDPMNAANLNKLGLGYDQEVELIRLGHEKDVLTVALCYDPEQAKRMAEAGADIIVAELGITSGGTVGAKTTLSEEDAKCLIQSVCDTARAVNPQVIVLCHGGSLEEPETVEKMLNAVTGVAGFLGGSATDRLPIEEGITKTAEGFKADKLYGF